MNPHAFFQKKREAVQRCRTKKIEKLKLENGKYYVDYRAMCIVKSLLPLLKFHSYFNM